MHDCISIKGYARLSEICSGKTQALQMYELQLCDLHDIKNQEIVLYGTFKRSWWKKYEIGAKCIFQSFAFAHKTFAVPH